MKTQYAEIGEALQVNPGKAEVSSERASRKCDRLEVRQRVNEGVDSFRPSEDVRNVQDFDPATPHREMLEYAGMKVDRGDGHRMNVWIDEDLQSSRWRGSIKDNTYTIKAARRVPDIELGPEDAVVKGDLSPTMADPGDDNPLDLKGFVVIERNVLQVAKGVEYSA